MARSSDDLPALGGPIRPASAISRSSRRTSSSAPGRPDSATWGARLTELLKWTLPRPPAPPRRAGAGGGGGGRAPPPPAPRQPPPPRHGRRRRRRDRRAARRAHGG